MHDWNWSFHMGWMMIWWVLGAFAVIYFVTWAARSGPTGGPSAEQTLKDRYARGEIDRDEYEQKLDDLRH